MVLKVKEIFKKVDKILKERNQFPDLSELEKGSKKAKSKLQKLFGLFKKIFNTQYAVIASYMKEELKTAFRNDLKLVGIIIGFLVLIVIVFAVFWLFISLAISAFFYESGYSVLHSILLTMAIHLLVIIVLSIGIYISSRNFKTHKVYKKVKKSLPFKK